MGHPEPFRLNYIEIGNENSGEVYEVRYRKFYDAIRKRYPHIRLIANTHLEEKGLQADIVDEHFTALRNSLRKIPIIMIITTGRTRKIFFWESWQ